MTTVMCFGTFDGLHQGHHSYFAQAKEIGKRLVVVVARDETVVEVKGQLPATNERDRLASVREHPLVDEAHLGQPGDKYEIIERVRPEIVLLGYDQTAFTTDLETELARRGLKVDIRRALPYLPKVFKSSYLQAVEDTTEVDRDFFE